MATNKQFKIANNYTELQVAFPEAAEAYRLALETEIAAVFAEGGDPHLISQALVVGAAERGDSGELWVDDQDRAHWDVHCAMGGPIRMIWRDGPGGWFEWDEDDDDDDDDGEG
jgi:hypothetical protein